MSFTPLHTMTKLIVVIAVMIYIFVINTSSALRRCSQTLLSPNPFFLLIRTCSLSSLAPLDEEYLQTVEECEQFAVKHRALAFNFVSPEELQSRSQMTCIVYECQELDPLLLEDNSMYDYYGIYRDLDPDSNLTCVPGVGMFHLHPEAANYSDAQEGCEGEEAQLARVTSARRTTHLSTLVASLGPRSVLQRAYVGLSDILQEGLFITVNDEPLNCFDYRGWAPGEPRSRRAEDCVVLDSRLGWRAVDCGLKLPFLCELTETVPDSCVGGRSKKPGRKCRADAEYSRRRQRKRLQQCEQQISVANADEEDERFQ